LPCSAIKGNQMAMGLADKRSVKAEAFEGSLVCLRHILR
jgi:hypothetical protein